MKMIILMGSQGSGKKTQAQKLTHKLEENGAAVLPVDAGDALRDFVEGEGPVRRKVKETMEHGGILPFFISTYVVARELFEHDAAHDHAILDGYPRTLLQAQELDSALDYLSPEASAAQVCWIEVSREESIRRLLARGRSDDTRESIETRLEWSERNTKEILDFYEQSDRYTVHRINGEQTPEQVHQELVNNLSG